MTSCTKRIGLVGFLLICISLALASPAHAVEQTGKWTVCESNSYKDLYFEEARWKIQKFNADGSAVVELEQRAWNKPGKFNQWTHNEQIKMDGKEVAWIRHDGVPGWTDANVHSASCTFTASKGKHHVISTSHPLPGLAGQEVVTVAWNFWINIPFDIDASADKGGSISPSGAQKADQGSSKTYKIQADKGYRVKDVVVDGKSVGAKDSYTFKNIEADHTIKATFQKTWEVTFVDHDGTVLKKQTVDDGAGATAPTDPKRDDHTFTGWDREFGKITEDTTVRAEYKANIKVRVPALVACTVLPSGEVVEPTGYAIENLSAVAVKTVGIEVSDQSPSTRMRMLDGGATAWDSANGGGFAIDAKASKPFEWEVDDLTGAANHELLETALTGPAKVADVTFTFEEA